jgi:hypothetical protein
MKKTLMKTEKPITTVDGFLKIIEASDAPARRNDGLPGRLFRGQPVDKPLLPKFAREAQKNHLAEAPEVEKRLLDDFSRLALPHLSSARPRNRIEWLAVAQHHGLATRLLDWTGNPLFALWFAVRKEPEGDSGAFWILEVSDEHLLPLDARKDVFDLAWTYLFRPPHITQRIVVQDGWFTLHRYLEEKDKFIALENQKRFKGNLKKFIIPAVAFSSLKSQLEHLNLSDHVLFPDLSTLCDQLQARVFPSAH